MGNINHWEYPGKADRKMVKVWTWRFSLMWILIIWFCIGPLIFVVPSIFPVLIFISLLTVVTGRWWAYLYWENYSFAILEDKVVINQGVITKRRVSIPYERIQNVNVVKGILERMYDVANVHIETAGGTHVGPEGAIMGQVNPDHLEDHILTEVERTRGSDRNGCEHTSDLGLLREELRSLNHTLGMMAAHGGILGRRETGGPVSYKCPECDEVFPAPKSGHGYNILCPNCGVSGQMGA